jgi:hypothetical protein
MNPPTSSQTFCIDPNKAQLENNSEYIRKLVYQNKILLDDIKRLKDIEALYNQ